MSNRILPWASTPGVAEVGPSKLCASRPWNAEDKARLQTLCDQGLSYDEIAGHLGRTRRAIRNMSLRLGGKRRREPVKPWTAAELETILTSHASGSTCVAIADLLPGRTPLAIFRKLCRLIGPAPTASAKRSKSEPIALFPVESRERSPILVPVQPAPVTATLEAMIRWLHSRDFMVIRRCEGWRVDRNDLEDDEALVEFANIRRARLRLAPFLLIESRPVLPLPTPSGRPFQSFAAFQRQSGAIHAR